MAASMPAPSDAGDNITGGVSGDSRTKSAEAKRTSVGGQALIEGLLMIGPEKVAIAVRKPDNEIELQIKQRASLTRVQKIPLLRGAVNLFKQMTIGVSALMYSAQFMEIEDEPEETGGDAKEADNDGSTAGKADDGCAAKKADDGAANLNGAAAGKSDSSGKKTGEDEPSRFEKFLDRKFGDKAKDIIIYAAVVLSLFFTVGLFILLPNFIAGFIPLDKASKSGSVLSNLCEGVIRVSLFLAYLALSSRLQEIKRVWQYHGAEHKTIHCFENGDPLEVGYIRKYSIKHPRCGTSFLFLVMIISILVFSIVDLAVLGLPFELKGVLRIVFSLLIRLITIPLVAGVAYEVIKISGRYDNALTRVISAPGLLFQRFTTLEPDDGMLEVAIVAFQNALSGDESDMTW